MRNKFHKVESRNSLTIRFPEIAKEWDYEKNGELRPENISAGSHKSVFWVCPICKHSYPMRVCNRTSPSRKKTTNLCPICLGRTIIPGYNSLKARYPHIVDAEWCYERNDEDPDLIPPHTNKKYWWKCRYGHIYEASVNNKVSNNGGDCPYCSHQRLSPDCSLASMRPDLANEWHPTRNKLTPNDVAAQSNKYAWWQCPYGHEWKAKINNRYNGRGCPECAKGNSSSFPEQIIFYYIKQLFPDAINRYVLKRQEIDVYIPSINIGIEYDGEYYHSSNKSILKDSNKNQILSDAGIFLIRVREEGCAEMNSSNCKIYTYKYTSDYKYIEPVIAELVDYVCGIAHKNNTVQVSIKDIKNEIIKHLSHIPKGTDLASTSPELALDWDYKLNYPITPDMVKPGSSHRVFWICHRCGYRWSAIIGSRNRGSGCPKCARRQQYTTLEWIEKARMIHKGKYDYSKVVYVNVKTPVTIICKKHGEFSQLPSEHLSGKGCKYCAKQAFHPKESLATLYPEIAKEWDYIRNAQSGVTPETIGIDSKKKYYWHCDKGKNHSYLATISYRVHRKSGCAICHGKQVVYETSLACLRPDLAAEWCDENKYKPEEVGIGSARRILWKCDNPDHKPYYATVYNRVKLNAGCPECAGNIRSTVSFKKELHQKFPYITLIGNYKKSSVKITCKCTLCGYEWTPFPYNLLRSKRGCPKCMGLYDK